MTHVLAFDPGETIGVCGWTMGEDGNRVVDPEFFTHVKYDDFPTWWVEHITTPELVIDYIAVEDWILFGKTARKMAGSDMKSSQVIGMIKAFAKASKTEVIMQQSSILPSAGKMFGITIPSNHKNSHRFAAMIHGCLAMHERGEYKSVLEREKGL